MAFDALVVALGNPGPKYLKTRHNVGFMLADLLVQENRSAFQFKSAFEADLAEASIQDSRVLFVKPQTYMNLSGRSLVKIFQKNKELKELPLIVLHDEADLPLGRIKVKQGGGDAGHNGLKSLRDCLGNGESFRLRMGVGRPVRGGSQDVGDFLLEAFSKDEENAVIDMLVGASKVFAALLADGLAKAQGVAGEYNNES